MVGGGVVRGVTCVLYLSVFCKVGTFLSILD